MKIGVLMFLTARSGDPGEAAREAERLGYESFWVAEHLAIPATYKTRYPRSADGRVPDFYAELVDPFVALAAAAQTTQRIRLATGICLLPERNVIATAKAAATLDLYSGGRLLFGVGAGWFPEEAQIMGVRFERRWKHLRESVEALRELWACDEASYEGEFVRFPPVRLFPKPLQRPGPPIILGAHDTRYAPKRVARYCDGWCPSNLSPEQAGESIAEVKRLARERGRDPRGLDFSVVLLGQDVGPDADTMRRYADAGVGRLVVVPSESASGSAAQAVRRFAGVVEVAARL